MQAWLLEAHQSLHNTIRQYALSEQPGALPGTLPTPRGRRFGWQLRSKSSACPRAPWGWDPIQEYLSVNPHIWIAVQPALFKHALTTSRYTSACRERSFSVVDRLLSIINRLGSP